MSVHEGGGGIHDAAVDHHRGDGPKDAEGNAAAPEQALAEQYARQEADDPRREHLEGCPGPLAEQHVGRHHRHGAHQKARLSAEGHPGDDHQGQHRLEGGQHEESASAHHADGTEDGDHHQFPRLGFSPLEHQEEGQHRFYKDEDRDEIILGPTQIVDPDEDRQGDQQKDGDGGGDGALGELPLVPGRLDAHWLGRSPAQGKGADEQTGHQQQIQGNVLPGGGGKAVLRDELREVLVGQGVDEKTDRAYAADSGQQDAP